MGLPIKDKKCILLYMGAVKSYVKSDWNGPNKEKLTTLARELDNTVNPNELSAPDIDKLINEAKKNGEKRKVKRFVLDVNTSLRYLSTRKQSGCCNIFFKIK